MLRYFRFPKTTLSFMPLSQLRWQSIRTPPPPSSKGSKLQEQAPTKDRFPPKAFNPQDPRRRLAVLVDGSKVSPNNFTEVEPLIADDLGASVLCRMFCPSPISEIWADFMQKNPHFEWFRVEKFIPVHMQMVADAAHIAEYSNDNKIQGIVYFITEMEKHHFEKYFDRLKGRGLNQYIFSDKGCLSQVNEDMREGDGANQPRKK